MKLLERVGGSSGLKIVFGAAFFYAWLDALFMSVFLVRPESAGYIAEVAVILVFSLSIPGLVLAVVKRSIIERLLLSRKVLFIFALLGSLGSFLMIAADVTLSEIFLLLGTACGGLFFSMYQLGWGASFSLEGKWTATPYAAGSFAFAFIIDIPLLFMIPEASAVFFALLPVASGLLFVSLKDDQRTYRKLQSNTISKLGIKSRLRSYLGISFMLLGAVVFVMVGFGYMQHLVSFSGYAMGNVTGGIIIQVARGVIAILMFLVIVIFSRRASIVYRIGLLAMIAGFMLMSSVFGTDLLWLAGAILISGYTAFDLLIWVAFSQIAYAQSHDPLRTIAVVRLIAVLCCAVGGIIGIILVGFEDQLFQFVATGTTIIGYLVVIATVLVLSSEDIWVLFGHNTVFSQSTNSDEYTDPDERLNEWLEKSGLTARQREIAVLLAYGRTQPWIAGNLMISENTVGTHVRHIYQKLNVHNRQEFIDLVFFLSSPEPRDTRDTLTQDT